MHKLRTYLTHALVASALLLGLPAAAAQTVVGSNLQFTWTTNTTTTTGQLAKYIVFNAVTAPRPGTWGVDWTVSGTTFSACTFHAEGSSDGVNWFSLDGGTPISCTVNGNKFETGEPVLFMHINLVTFTRGDATSVVAFHFTGQRS
jgi:hypothetical protein